MKRKLYEHRHPFDEYAFEAFLGGTWSAVDVIEIMEGKVTLHFMNGGLLTAKKTPFSNIRLKCRKPTLADCTCFLRPGIDICVMSLSRLCRDTDENTLMPVWNDAKICYIQRRPHETRCTCQFYVKFYEGDGFERNGTENFSKVVTVVSIDQISILQKLEKIPCENVHYRWEFAEDCPSVQSSKLFVGKFSSDLTWLVVVSCLKQAKFVLRSFENKIVYQIIGNNLDTNITISTRISHAINFRKENGVLVPILMPFSVNCPAVVYESSNSRIVPFCDLLCLRRSPRCNIQLNYDLFSGYLLRSNIPPIQVEAPKPKFREITSVSSRLAKEPTKIEKRMLEWRKEAQISEDDGVGDTDGVTCKRVRFRARTRTSIRKVSSSDGDGRWDSDTLGRKTRRKSSRTRFYNVEKSYTPRAHRNTYCSREYNETIQKYMHNIDLGIKNEPSADTEHWKELLVMAGQADKWKSSMQSSTNEEVQKLDMLWKEMELSISPTYIFEETTDSRLEEENATPVGNPCGKNCQHEYKLDEEIGILCHLCGSVSTEIDRVFPDFEHHMTRTSQISKGSENMSSEDDTLELFPVPAMQEQKPFSGNVWDFIPDLKSKLHLHQIKAFEFLWKNIAGTVEPMSLERHTDRGGCVISHSPGSGKTFLVITFLISYLKIFPGARPLVLAPKTVLYVWYKEALKWDIPIPIYHIHGQRGFRHSSHCREAAAGDVKQGREVVHALDCLKKIHNWHSHPSILLLGYTSFLSLTRESRLLHRRYLSRVLCESPGILVLDEGHNPRSTRSRLRKMLMRVKTDLRVLLSGTLFQNNFSEYFNTLCIARPRFVEEVMKAFGPDQAENRTPAASEVLARKLFMEKVANRISSDVAKERECGLNLLRKMTAGFIDIHDGAASAPDPLPGLHYYTLLMNPAPAQLSPLRKLRQEVSISGTNQLELEILVTLCSIHPSLVRTAACAGRFFSGAEMEELERGGSGRGEGSTKVWFVVGLVHLAVWAGEKVLVFCRNLAPIRLLAEVLAAAFGWGRGEEVLELRGEMELAERAEAVERFEDRSGRARVMLASSTACSEGVSLTAASRVVLLDMEWNPARRKQAVARAFRPGQERVVYVYQLLMRGTIEEEKHGRTEYKERVSGMIFSEGGPGGGRPGGGGGGGGADGIEDDLLREIVEADRAKSFHVILKNGKSFGSGNPVRL